MFYVKGKVMERREFKTSKGNVIPVVAIWVQNGKRSFSYDFMDWDNNLKDVKENQIVLCPMAVHANSADKNVRAYLNMGVAGAPLSEKLLPEGSN